MYYWHIGDFRECEGRKRLLTRFVTHTCFFFLFFLVVHLVAEIPNIPMVRPHRRNIRRPQNVWNVWLKIGQLRLHTSSKEEVEHEQSEWDLSIFISVSYRDFFFFFFNNEKKKRRKLDRSRSPSRPFGYRNRRLFVWKSRLDGKKKKVATSVQFSPDLSSIGSSRLHFCEQGHWFFHFFFF